MKAMKDVTIVVPTFRRTADLVRAVESIFVQDIARPFSLMIVDNDPEASAEAVANELRRRLPADIAFSYIHEPAPGVANARNAAVEKVSTPLIAFLDDDQTASPGWLRALLQCHDRFPAAVTFGPVRAILPPSVRQHQQYLAGFFSRPEASSTGFTNDAFGCGNSLVDLEAIPPARPVFDTRMNETGGEDDILFSRIRAAGGSFAWAADAVVSEHVPASRAHLGYTLRRALAYGQGPITLARRQSPTNWVSIIYWMAVGAGKLALNSVLYLWGLATRSPGRAWNLDRASRGLGKLLWWVELRFYGASRL